MNELPPDPHSPAPEASYSTFGPMALPAVALMLLFGVLVSRPLDLNHDAAMYLDCGRMLLDGMKPYVDFADLNPPLIMYLTALPAALARWTGLQPIAAFHVWVGSLAAYASVLTFWIMNRRIDGIGIWTSGIAATLVLAFSMLLLFTTNLDWGQREHLFLLLYLPFFLTRFARWQGENPGTAVGIIAALLGAMGVCLKPHFVLLALTVELFHLVRTRQWRRFLAPECFAFVLGGVAYPVHFVLLPDEVRETFFGYLLPMIRGGYGTYNVPVQEVLTHPGFSLVLFSCAAGIAFGWGKTDTLAVLARTLFVFALVALLLYLQQQKGWTYHLIPAVFASSAGLLAAMGADTVRENGKSGARPDLRSAVWSRVGVGVLMLAGLPAWMMHGDLADPLEENVVAEVLRQETSPADSVLMISTTVGEIYPLLLHAERNPGSRYLWTFPIPMLYATGPESSGEVFQYRSRSDLGDAEARFLHELGQDIVHRRPRLILIDSYENPQGCPPGFTLPGYFGALSFLNDEMSEYAYWQDIFGWQIYRRESGRVRNASATQGDS